EVAPVPVVFEAPLEGWWNHGLRIRHRATGSVVATGVFHLGADLERGLPPGGYVVEQVQRVTGRVRRLPLEVGDVACEVPWVD
ncbi:MAG: hypothetical protein AAFZ65_18710, partial [Planctomycetota bacterium]